MTITVSFICGTALGFLLQSWKVLLVSWAIGAILSVIVLLRNKDYFADVRAALARVSQAKD